MGSKVRPGIFATLVDNFIRSFGGITRTVVGRDHFNNIYYTEQSKRATAKRSSVNRGYIPGNTTTWENLPVEWEAWLRGRRNHLPTQEEIDERQRKEQALRLKTAGQDIGPEIDAKSVPNIDTKLEDSGGKVPFPKYHEYEDMPGVQKKRIMLRIFRRLYSTTPRKRFYKNVEIVSSDVTVENRESFEVCLDRKKVRTPKNNVLRIPSEALALAIANEWDCQRDELNANQMQLTGLAVTATDNPLKESSASLTDQILQYLETDTIFFMENEPEQLRILQELHWGELIRWTKGTYDIDVQPSSTLTPPAIAPETLDRLRRHLMAYNFWSLVGFKYGVEAIKSVIIALATINCRLSVDDAVKISTLEQHFQTTTWGRVEWAHDLEHHETSTRLAAAVLFLHLNTSSKTVTRLRN